MNSMGKCFPWRICLAVEYSLQQSTCRFSTLGFLGLSMLAGMGSLGPVRLGSVLYWDRKKEPLLYSQDLRESLASGKGPLNILAPVWPALYDLPVWPLSWPPVYELFFFFFKFSVILWPNLKNLMTSNLQYRWVWHTYSSRVFPIWGEGIK